MTTICLTFEAPSSEFASVQSRSQVQVFICSAVETKGSWRKHGSSP